MDNREIVELVNKYKLLVNTQSRALFEEVFASSNQCQLIAVSHHFMNRESIYNDFLMGAIRNSYSRIELISDDLVINQISDTLATVVFKYHTDCDLRETGEFYSISGLETQVLIKENNGWKILHIHYSKV